MRARGLPVFATALAVLAAGTLAAGAQPIVLRAGSTGTQTPMSFVAADGTVTGVVPDLLNLVAADVGFTIEHVIPVALGQMVDALNGNRIDITVSTYAITADRAAAVAFSVPYMIQGEVLVIRRDDPGDYRGLTDLGGKRLGVVRNSSYQPMIEALPPGTFGEVRFYEFTAELPAAIVRGEIDAAIYGAPIAAWDVSQGNYPTLRLAENYVPSATQIFAFAMRKSDSEMLARINQSLERMMADGTVRAIFARYGLPYADYTR